MQRHSRDETDSWHGRSRESSSNAGAPMIEEDRDLELRIVTVFNHIMDNCRVCKILNAGVVEILTSGSRRSGHLSRIFVALLMGLCIMTVKTSLMVPSIRGTIGHSWSLCLLLFLRD